MGGIDRLQYEDYAGLTDEVSRLMRQQFGAPVKERDTETKARGAEGTSHLDAIAPEIPVVVKREPGLAIGGIASQNGRTGRGRKVPGAAARRRGCSPIRGVKRGMKYYPPE